MPKELSKNPDAYNRPFIVRDAVVFYGKGGEVEISKEQEDLLKEQYKDTEIPKEIVYKVEVKDVKIPK